MNVTVYADFNCPYSYLASQRADRLMRLGAAGVDWRAVEHDRGLPLTGSRADADRARWDAELAEVASLALPGEDAPAAPPGLVSNTAAAVAAYAEAVSDGVQDELRRRLFRAIWAEGRHISSAYEVRRLVSQIMTPPVPVQAHLAAPDLPMPILHDLDQARIVRRSGGTIAPDGGPLTTTGHLRIRQWRQEWLALPRQAVPTVVGPDGVDHPGTEGLRFLAGLLPVARAGDAAGGRTAAAVASGDPGSGRDAVKEVPAQAGPGGRGPGLSRAAGDPA
ncbi:MAG TPA: DsbA family protein [Streptosporangiaceae bacterium]|nr:DsbA family protein [Streptosporangiaceae bacterium]